MQKPAPASPPPSQTKLRPSVPGDRKMSQGSAAKDRSNPGPAAKDQRRSGLLDRGAEIPQGKRSLRLHLLFWLAVALPVMLMACTKVDRGGVIASRELHVKSLGDQRVEIEGTCLSACTLQLGAANVCVHRSAKLGFHGPSASGKPLSPDEFERWSLRIASHYREPLRSQFMTQWRYEIDTVFLLTGAEVIALGYPAC